VAQKLLNKKCEGHRVFHLVGEPTTPFEFGKQVARIFGYTDVPLLSASVQGTAYCPHLWLSHEKTTQSLNGWKGLSHEAALLDIKSSRVCP
jgi:hypothetical protein